MSKFKMPQDKATPVAQVEDWVTGIQPVASAPPAPQRPAASAKLARLTIDLPPELHARFKAACAIKGTRMIDQVRGFIEEWTQKDG